MFFANHFPPAAEPPPPDYNHVRVINQYETLLDQATDAAKRIGDVFVARNLGSLVDYIIDTGKPKIPFREYASR